MCAKESRENNRRLSVPRTAIILTIPALIALGAGVHLGLKAAQVEREKIQSHALNEAKAHTRGLADSVWDSIEMVRTRALSIYQIRSATPNQAAALPLLEGKARHQQGGALLHWSELEVDGDRVVSVRQSLRSSTWNPQGGAQAFEEFYFRSLLERLSLKEMKQNEVAMLRVKQDPQRSAEWLALAFPIPGGRPGAVAALIDPAEGFPALSRWMSRSENGQLRAYLVGSDGYVFAHSQKNYAATSFKDTDIFSNALKPILEGTRVSGAGTFQSIDRIPVTAAYARLDSLPIGVVTERVSHWNLTAMQIWRKVAGSVVLVLFVMGGLILMAAWALRVFGEVELETDPESQSLESELLRLSVPTKETMLPPPAPAPRPVQLAKDVSKVALVGPTEGEDQSKIIAEAIQKFSENNVLIAQEAEVKQHEVVNTNNEIALAKRAFDALKEETEIINRFEQDATSLRDPKTVVCRLTATASRICGSPAMFFSYREGYGSAALFSHAGFKPTAAPGAMSFPLENKLMNQIVNSAARGESFSLADYEPLAQLILAKTGNAHFEAWPLTGYGPLGRMTGNPKLMGVLVILEAGIESVTRHDSLRRMMRATGLIYENTLLSQ